MKAQIELETQTDVMNFVKIVTEIEEDVTVTDGDGLRVNGKSLMGMLYALEFNELWCECQVDIYQKIKNYIVE